VQGSAKIRLPDGDLITVGYAASSGHDYQSIAEMLVDDEKIPRDRMSLAAMIDYFKRHPGQVDRYVRQNPRYVFFRLSEGTPHGSLNEPVTPWRTIATDKSIFPRAALAFVSTTLPRPEGGLIVTRPYDGFEPGPTTASSSIRTPAAPSEPPAAATSTWAKATAPDNSPAKPTRKAGSTTSSSNRNRPPPRISHRRVSLKRSWHAGGSVKRQLGDGGVVCRVWHYTNSGR